ncbi:MAG: M23 family metallopeptidase [Polyangiales bacterium]|nr:M23 family metallopeptidase [Myxococcales bacterium]MCB9659102.1 M23 family metallopeptidase [Sandaracinaceae bacterium]
MMERADVAHAWAALGLCCALGAALAGETFATAQEPEDWVEFEDGHTGETVRAPARDQRDEEAPSEPEAAPEPPDDSQPIATPRPTEWMPNQGAQCRRRRRHRFCDGPLRVPRPHGEAAALAERLRLGTRAGQFVLEHAARGEWVAAVTGPARNTLRWPVDGGNLWRGLQPRRGRHHEHTGVDIGAREGTFVLAANDGLVIYAHNDITGYGNMVTVTHADGTSTMYAHLRAAYVFPGMQVRRAQVLGEVGETGIAHGAHLHFEWRIDGVPANPLPRFTRVPDRAQRRIAQLEAGR